MSKKDANFSQEIPIDGKDNFDNVAAACKKMGLTFRKAGRGFTSVWVRYETPLDLYFLGANVIGESTGIFKSPLTQ